MIFLFYVEIFVFKVDWCIFLYIKWNLSYIWYKKINGKRLFKVNLWNDKFGDCCWWIVKWGFDGKNYGDG